MRIQRICAIALVATQGLIFSALAAAPPTPKEQVWAAEQAFARTMAQRNREAFGEHVSDEAVFFAGTTPLRGKSKVIEGWASFFDGPQAPFSWEPDQVEVLASGTLALSTGPVRDPAGKIIARFNSVCGSRRAVSGASSSTRAARPALVRSEDLHLIRAAAFVYCSSGC